jgi:hypothetical protein
MLTENEFYEEYALCVFLSIHPIQFLIWISEWKLNTLHDSIPPKIIKLLQPLIW